MLRNARVAAFSEAEAMLPSARAEACLAATAEAVSQAVIAALAVEAAASEAEVQGVLAEVAAWAAEAIAVAVTPVTDKDVKLFLKRGV